MTFVDMKLKLAIIDKIAKIIIVVIIAYVAFLYRDPLFEVLKQNKSNEKSKLDSSNVLIVPCQTGQCQNSHPLPPQVNSKISASQSTKPTTPQKSGAELKGKKDGCE